MVKILTLKNTLLTFKKKRLIKVKLIIYYTYPTFFTFNNYRRTDVHMLMNKPAGEANRSSLPYILHLLRTVELFLSK